MDLNLRGIEWTGRMQEARIVTGARSGPGAARTILLVHIISARPSKQPLIIRTFLYGAWLLFFVSARTNKGHHHMHGG